MAPIDIASRQHELLKDGWAHLRTLLPRDLDEGAARTQALRRRRGVNSAADLLRMLLAYSTADLSLKDVAAWAKGMKLSTMSTEALFYRVRDAEGWLAELLSEQVSAAVRPVHTGLRLRIVDATVLTGPGSKGTDWRLHAFWDAHSARLAGIVLGDSKIGESYGLHPARAGDVILGDRGYAYARSIDAAAQAGADVVVRFNPQTVRLCSSSKAPIEIQHAEQQIPQTGVHTWGLMLPVPPPKTKSRKPWRLDQAIRWIPVTVAAARTRSGRVIWVLTTLRQDQMSGEEVMDLYRLRWQIELAFKRLKSLAWLDTLPTKKGPTARSWILGRLLLAALAQRLADPSGALSPWGYRLRGS